MRLSQAAGAVNAPSGRASFGRRLSLYDVVFSSPEGCCPDGAFTAPDIFPSSRLAAYSLCHLPSSVSAIMPGACLTQANQYQRSYSGSVGEKLTWPLQRQVPSTQPLALIVSRPSSCRICCFGLKKRSPPPSLLLRYIALTRVIPKGGGKPCTCKSVLHPRGAV